MILIDSEGCFWKCLLAALILLFPAPAFSKEDPRFAGRWWSSLSFWNTQIQQEEETDYSQAAIDAYRVINKPINLNWDSAGVAVIYSDGLSDPKADIVFRNYPDWLWKFPDVPQSASLIEAIRYRLAKKNTDGMTCLFDAKRQGFFSFWQPTVNEDGKTISIVTGSFNPISGFGASAVNQFTPSGGRVAGTNYCGGLIRPEEIEQGEIQHALAMVWPSNLNRSWDASKKGGVPATVFPAHNTDGTSVNINGTIPMGAHLQLDPKLTETDLKQLGLLRPADYVVARALQVYGAYIVDSNTPNSNAGLYFQSGFGHGASIYQATNPWPVEIVSHMKFIAPPERIPLDTAERVGLPVRIK